MSSVYRQLHRSPDCAGNRSAPLMRHLPFPSHPATNVADGTDTHHLRLAILVPLVQPGGLGSCTSSRTPKPPPPRRLSYFCAIGNRIFAKAGPASHSKEARLHSTNFDFDVITGRSVPADHKP